MMRRKIWGEKMCVLSRGDLDLWYHANTGILRSTFSVTSAHRVVIELLPKVHSLLFQQTCQSKLIGQKNSLLGWRVNNKDWFVFDIDRGAVQRTLLSNIEVAPADSFNIIAIAICIVIKASILECLDNSTHTRPLTLEPHTACMYIHIHMHACMYIHVHIHICTYKRVHTRFSSNMKESLHTYAGLAE